MGKLSCCGREWAIRSRFKAVSPMSRESPERMMHARFSISVSESDAIFCSRLSWLISFFGNCSGKERKE